MTKLNHTGLKDPLPSEWHRKMGNRVYMTDIDNLEYCFRAGKRVFIAIIDDKHGDAKSLSLKYDPMQAQLDLAEQLNIPHFIAISYLHKDVPVYYVIGTNELGKSKMARFLEGLKEQMKVRQWEDDRSWLSPKQYSQFQHFIRDVDWNPWELDDKTGFKLQDLPEKVLVYALPFIDF